MRQRLDLHAPEQLEPIEVRSRLCTTAASPYGSPGRSTISRSIVSVLMRRLPAMMTWSTMICGPSTIVKRTSARVSFSANVGCGVTTTLSNPRS